MCPPMGGLHRDREKQNEIRYSKVKSRAVGSTHRKNKHWARNAAKARLAKSLKLSKANSNVSATAHDSMEQDAPPGASAADIGLPVTAADDTTVSPDDLPTAVLASHNNPVGAGAPSLPIPALNIRLSSNKRRGYHPQRAVRRPHRYASLQASKASGDGPPGGHKEPLPKEIA